MQVHHYYDRSAWYLTFYVCAKCDYIFHETLKAIMAYVIMTPFYEQIILWIILGMLSNNTFVTNHRPTFHSTYTFTKRLALRLINIEQDTCFLWMKWIYFASLITGFGRESIMVMYLLIYIYIHMCVCVLRVHARVCLHACMCSHVCVCHNLECKAVKTQQTKYMHCIVNYPNPI